MNILGIVIVFCLICGAVYEVASIVSDSLRVNSIEQKSWNGDATNATNEAGQFVADKTTDFAYGAVASAILAVIWEIVGVFAGIILGIVGFIKALG